MEKKKSSHLTYGIVISLITIVYGLILHFTGQEMNNGLRFVSLLIFVIGIVVACLNFSKENFGNVTFGNLFGYGFKVVAVITIITIIWTFLFMKVIFPDSMDKALEYQRTAMSKKGMSSSDIDLSLGWVKEHFMLITVGTILIGYAIFGAISSLIGAAVAKKNPQANNPFVQ